MKRLFGLSLAAIFVVGMIGCGDPCKKTMDMTIKCAPKEAQADIKKGKDDFIKACKKSDKMKKMLKKCAGITDCKKFKECFKKLEM